MRPPTWPSQQLLSTPSASPAQTRFWEFPLSTVTPGPSAGALLVLSKSWHPAALGLCATQFLRHPCPVLAGHLALCTKLRHLRAISENRAAASPKEGRLKEAGKRAKRGTLEWWFWAPAGGHTPPSPCHYLASQDDAHRPSSPWREAFTLAASTGDGMRTLAVPMGRGPYARPQPAALQCAGAPHPPCGTSVLGRGQPRARELRFCFGASVVLQQRQPQQAWPSSSGWGSGSLCCF